MTTLTFSQATRQVNSLSVGNVIVSDVSDLTPYGLLRKITNIVINGDQIVVQTVAATLEDAIENGTVENSWHLLPDGSATPLTATSNIYNGPSVNSTASTNSTTGFYFDINDVVLYDKDGNLDTEGDQITADGSIAANIGFDFMIKISNWKLTEARFTTTLTETCELEISAKLTVAEVNKKVEIYRQYLNPIVIWVGFVPVVILPVLTVNVGLDAEVSVGITTTVTQTASLTNGVGFNNGTWSPITNLSNSFDWEPPALTAGCDVKGYAGPQLSFLLYGLADPYGEVRGYLELEADLFKTPWWELYGGLEADVGFKMDVLGHSISDYELPLVIGYRILLAQAPANKILIYYGNGGPQPGSASDGQVNFNQLKVHYESKGYHTDYTDSFPTDLKVYKLIILVAPGYANDSGINFFTAQQVTAFKNFMTAGGRFVVMGDHSGFFGMNTVNDLLVNLGVGIRQNADVATNDADSCPPLTDITPDQITAGVSALDLSASSSLTLSGSAKSLLRVPSGWTCGAGPIGATLMAVDQIAGTAPRPGSDLLVIGDTQVLDDYMFSDPAGDGIADNLKLADNLFEF